jgi:D-3-phosphoglycerate dehydrogenase
MCEGALMHSDEQSGPWSVAALSPLPANLLNELLAPFGDSITVSVPTTRDRPGLLAALAGAELVLGDWSGTFPLDAGAVAAAPRLAFVQLPVVGVDGTDVEALTAAGIPLANAAGSNSAAVAEWCLAAALALGRRIRTVDAAVRSGGWIRPTLDVPELSSRRIGLVGFGAIGQACARVFTALGCSVGYWSRRRRSPAEEYGAQHQELDDLLSTSDIVVVVVALTPDTYHLLDERRLALLPRGAHVVHAARGPVVDQRALLSAVDSGRLAGAALDVFDPEPPAPDDVVRGHPEVLLSSHVAGATRQTWERVVRLVADNLDAATSGRPVRHVVNQVDPVVRRRPAPKF